jgi:hypothetical protein
MGILESIIISGLWALAYIAGILFIAYGFVWLMDKLFGIKFEGNMYYWGRVFVILLCVIVIVGWLFGTIDTLIGGASFRFPAPYRR